MLDPNFVLDDEGRDRLIARFGTGVDAWCAALPDLVERYCLRWHLELDKVLAGNTSRVFIGRQHGDRGVVLKLTPDLTVLRLRHRSHDGTAQLLLKLAAST